jgi:hypothetical protein
MEIISNDRIKEYKKEYYKKNREGILSKNKQYSKIYYALHEEEIKKKNLERYHANKKKKLQI